MIIISIKCKSLLSLLTITQLKWSKHSKNEPIIDANDNNDNKSIQKRKFDGNEKKRKIHIDILYNNKHKLTSKSKYYEKKKRIE